jgi:hypothetical protein
LGTGAGCGSDRSHWRRLVGARARRRVDPTGRGARSAGPPPARLRPRATTATASSSESGRG